jgi:selenocysteine lyase/cysteine desulfurase
MDKRSFIKQISLLSMATTLPFIEALAKNFEAVSHISSQELASNEDFWSSIREGYLLNKDYINLENGYYCMLPQESLNHYLENVRSVNFLASRYMRTVQFENRNAARQQLADVAGCSFDEVVITRNTTESLDLVISGQDWSRGDEAIYAEQDYGSMMDMFRLMGERHGIVSKIVSLPNHPKNDKEIIDLYASQINDKTKLLMVSHVVNITGQVLPVRKICDMAHDNGIEVMVDGAHAFAHLNFKIPDLNCDYYGTSLHKWLNVPLGAGLLYVKKDKIKNLWPLFAEAKLPRDDIDRLNHTGTTPVHVELSIPGAIEHYQVIGAERKEQRLKYLKEYWTSKVKSNPNIILNTPFESERSCAIANVGIKNMNSKEMAKVLFDTYNIWVVAIDRPGVHGCRITPNVYTSTKELDRFVEALSQMAL